ncbi:MAG: hydrogen peroxide-inducible genes activator [Devosiaceae bacterium]|nr:hydrogen peroxide-inducible genes activator [Devosiaceae bacterium MH13]
MDRLTLKQLRYFNAVGRLGHFGRAAEACGISQPALSMQIQQLEETIGAPLFERGGKLVHLTAIGSALAPRVQDILRSVDELAEIARFDGDGLPAQLRLGIIPTVAPYLLPSVIGALTARNAALDLKVRETQTPRLLDDLSEGRLDAAILALPVSEPTLTELPLFDEPFMLVRPADDADKPIPSPERLRQMRLLLLEEGHCFRDQALAFCGTSAGHPREILDGSSLSTLVQMVGAGIGVTLIPKMALPVETRSAAVSVARFPAPEPSRTIGMVWRRTNPLAKALAQVARTVQEASAEANLNPS